MCGIAGYIDFKDGASEDVLRDMLPSLVKRGPDDEGVFVNGLAGLAYRRLSIIDVEGGHQPILNEDESLALVCNGEIYDYQQIRHKLQQQGHTFRTHSDSEVILHLYEENGADCLYELNGMFAFAILDIKTNAVFLARDRFGQKPLFYVQEGKRFAFASGPQSLISLPWVDKELDLIGIHHYLEYQYIPEPRSIYQKIRKMPPHSFGFWNGGELDIHSYWSPALNVNSELGYEDVCTNVRNKLQAAVERRMVADVPVGMFLSGGMDSGLICAMAQQVSDDPVHTFSIAFSEQKYDESDFAQQVADKLGTEHHTMKVQPDDFDFLRHTVADFEEPFADSSMLPTALLARFTRRHVKVALSGDGADELFGGYYRYRVMHLMQALDSCPGYLRRTMANMLLTVLPARKEERTKLGGLRRLIEISRGNGLQRYLDVISRFPGHLRDQVYTPYMQNAVRDCRDTEVLEEFWRYHSTFVNSIMEVDISTYLNNDILTKVDRASMGYGLEVRSPFLDSEVADSALRLPYKWKQAGKRRKVILQDACRDLLPQHIFSRPKMGFGVPIARWFRREWRDKAREIIMDGELSRSGLFDRESLNHLLDAHIQGKQDYSYPLFALLVLDLWMQNTDL